MAFIVATVRRFIHHLIGIGIEFVTAQTGVNARRHGPVIGRRRRRRHRVVRAVMFSQNDVDRVTRRRRQFHSGRRQIQHLRRIRIVRRLINPLNHFSAGIVRRRSRRNRGRLAQQTGQNWIGFVVGRIIDVHGRRERWRRGGSRRRLVNLHVPLQVALVRRGVIAIDAGELLVAGMDGVMAP